MAGLSNIFGGDYDDDSVDGQDSDLDVAAPDQAGLADEAVPDSGSSLIGTADDGGIMSDEASE